MLSNVLLLMFYFLFLRKISEFPPPIAAKLCKHDQKPVAFCNAGSKIGGPPLKKIRRPKHAKFGAKSTTSDFDHEYLRISKSERRDRRQSLPRSAKKTSEL